MDSFVVWLRDVCYPGLDFCISSEKGRSFLYIESTSLDNSTGEECTWKSRKWRLSCHMTKSEFIQTCFKAVLTAVEHETRERFKYKDKAIFGPHINVDKLHEICEEVDVREDSLSGV